MLEWLQQIPAERVLLWVFAAGAAWSQLRAARASLKSQGQRIGDVEKGIAELRGELRARLEALRGDGR